MRVLWYCNVILPEVADAAGISDKAHSAGWVEGFLLGLRKQPDVTLGIICPWTEYREGEHDGFQYWLCSSEQYEKVLDQFKPDILHVFGTENEESNKLVTLFNNPRRTVVNIQGMATLYADVYTDNLPAKLQLRQRIFESFLRNGILDQRDKLRSRGEAESDTIKKVCHVIGRTDIDRMFAQNLNPDIQYHHCNEILRDNFYKGKQWNIENIQRHSIVIRNTSNPIKGFYQVIRAMPFILQKFPDAHLYVVGNSYASPKNLKQKFTEGSYNRLVRKTVQRLGLADHITALGTLDAEQMEQLYLRAHVVVSASIIENESNVVSEAKILGVPVVASYVGGLPNRIIHKYDGYLYPFNMPAMMAYYVSELFGDDNVAEQISKNAMKTQAEINDPSCNIATLVEIYKKISKIPE